MQDHGAGARDLAFGVLQRNVPPRRELSRPAVVDHLVGEKPGTGPKRFLFVGHYDTVFASGTAKQRPFRIDGQGRAWGPGVYDMKGGLAALLYALRAHRALGCRGVTRADFRLDPDDPDPVAVIVDLHMLTQCDGGRQRSADELRSLLAAAGLGPGEVHLTGGPALIEGIA